MADRVLELAVAGDDAAFAELVAPLRGELHAHCYRMLGSVHDADDALQDALVRAWRGLAGFSGRGSLRSWLYAVTTHSCLDAARSRRRRALPMDLGPSSTTVVDSPPRTDVAWLGPHPDERYERREAVELAFVAALQHLPPNQRAALLMFEVLGFTADEIADALATSTASVTSAIQRARATAGSRTSRTSGASDGRDPATPTPGERAVAAAFADALERGDAATLVARLAADVTWAMPPMPAWYAGREAVTAFARAVPLSGTCGTWRTVQTTANALPAVACYLDSGNGHFAAWSVNAIAVQNDRIAAITTFQDPAYFPLFGLPLSL
ncbi:RNA polymerase subunit sigma-70 [Kribbella sp. DT2]|uniref:RNA polymerase subunit sigma-70 n=1 Tax=Kribbella sp. DT2 TaxID=3393427 RepID=UPI003CF73ABE